MADAPNGPAAAVYDRQYLPPAAVELVVISDTHYLLRPELQGGEWRSIQAFPRRTERALRLAGALRAPLVVHLGDVTHEYPETGQSRAARLAAQEQLAANGLHPYHAAGNMDIGDKPDPTSPAEWVSEQTLADWHAHFGPSWYSFDAHGLHGIVLNTQIMNGPLPAAAEQQRWLEADLAASAGRRILLFLHMPPFFVDEDERAYGFYNSLDEPARGWLLDLIRRYRIELVFAGHTHFVALHHLDGARFFIAPSTATSRAGMPEAFTVCPPDQGRSDEDKLGFYLVRLFAQGASVHLIRSGRDTPALDADDPRRLLLTRTTRDLPESRLGVVASHPLGHMTPGPIIWPSVVRQRVRNDWPLLALLEMGARWLRVPESDLSEASERERLAVLRREGVALQAAWLWSDRLDLPGEVARRRDQIDGVEVVVPGAPLPPPACLEQVARVRALGLPVTLATALRGVAAPGQYHKRTRVGYRDEDIPALAAWLEQHGAAVDRLLVRLYAADPPWAAVTALRDRLPLDRLGALDFVLDFPDQDEAAHAGMAAEALCAVATVPGARLFLSPLLDMDRSMDVYHGLLDRLANPRPAAVAARLLATILFSAPAAYEPAPPLTVDGRRVLPLAGGGRRLWLLPDAGRPGVALNGGPLGLRPGTEVTAYDLVAGLSEPLRVAAGGTLEGATVADSAGPVLLVAGPGGA